MTRPYSEPAEFYLNPSQGLIYFLDILHAFALIILACLKISIFWKILFLPLLLWHWKINKAIHAVRSHPESIIRLWQETEMRFGFETRSGHQARGHLTQESYKCPWFLIIILKLMNRKVIFIIPRDSLPFFEFRMLCQRVLNNDSKDAV